jgi:hypothetical protein
MRLIALGAIATVLTANVEAADFAYPPSAAVAPQYDVAPGPAVAPPQVLVVPGAPGVVPRYNGAPALPALAGPSPYGEAPPVASPDFTPGTSLPPRAACEAVWRCGNRGCGWGPSCPPHSEPYASPYRSPAPPVYSQAAPQPYAGPNGVPGPQLYSGPNAPPAPEPYSGPYTPQGSGQYTPQLYSGQPGPMRWIIGPQPYGL